MTWRVPPGWVCREITATMPGKRPETVAVIDRQTGKKISLNRRHAVFCNGAVFIPDWLNKKIFHKETDRETGDHLSR